MSAVGNDVTPTLPRCARFAAPRAGAPTLRRLGGVQAGFTLIELMVVIALIAIATAGVTFAFRDNEATLLDREADRLSTILEAIRVQSRSTGVALAWLPLPQGFVVLPVAALSGRQLQINPASINPWLGPGMKAEILNASTLASQSSLLLGAEPMIAPAAVVLSLGERRLQVTTDGLRPFTVQPASQGVKP